MNYVAIDIHKRYSVLAAQDETGRKPKEARIEGNSSEDYVRFFQSLEGPSRAVLEACWHCLGHRLNLPAHIINVRQLARRGEVCLNKDGPPAVSRLTVICIP